MRASDQKQKKRKEYEENVRQKKNICTHAHSHGRDVMRDMIVRFQDNRQTTYSKDSAVTVRDTAVILGIQDNRLYTVPV